MTTTLVESSTQLSRDQRSPWVSATALSIVILGTVLSLWPVLAGDFTNRDDQLTVAGNPLLKPPSMAGVVRYWKASAWGLYMPVTYTVWSGVAMLSPEPLMPEQPYKLDPRLFHAANLITHVLGAIAAWLVLRRLFNGIWPAGIGAMVFAMHPVQVDAVAWVSGLKDLLAGSFALLATWQYIISVQEKPDAPSRTVHYWLCLIAIVVAVLSKVSAAMLPGVLIAIDWFLLKRSPRQIAQSIVPIFLVCLPPIVAGRVIQDPEPLIKLWQAPMVALFSLTFYASKIVWPFSLAPDYDLSPLDILASKWLWACWIVPLAATLILWLLRRRRPELIAGAAGAVICVSPVLGFVPFMYQPDSNVTDHYLYLSMFGVALMVAGTLARHRSIVVNALATLIVAGLGVLTHQQAGYWRDTVTLFTHNAKVTPHNWRPEYAVAEALLEKRQYKAAESHLRASIAIQPSHFAYSNLAIARFAQGDSRDAIFCLEQAALLKPEWASLHLQLAEAYLRYDRPADAEVSARRAMQMWADNPRCAQVLAEALKRQGKS